MGSCALTFPRDIFAMISHIVVMPTNALIKVICLYKKKRILVSHPSSDMTGTWSKPFSCIISSTDWIDVFFETVTGSRIFKLDTGFECHHSLLGSSLTSRKARSIIQSSLKNFVLKSNHYLWTFCVYIFIEFTCNFELNPEERQRNFDLLSNRSLYRLERHRT